MKEEITWSDFLGIPIQDKNKDHYTFKEARKFVNKLGLKNHREWLGYVKSGKKPVGIPADPRCVYALKGEWTTWGDWLGNGNRSCRNRKYRPFKQSRKFVRELGLKNENEWRDYRKSDKPEDIPSNPNKIYKNDGWVSMGDFLGTGNTRKKDFLSFKEARSFVRSLGLKSAKEWRAYAASGNRPEYIPSNPVVVYNNKGWISWGHFLGNKNIASMKIDYLPFKEARKFVKKMNLQTEKEWAIYCNSGEKPKNIPYAPRLFYKEEWVSMGDWLGTGRVYKKDFVSYEEAKKIIQKHGINNRKKWICFCSEGKRPLKIPSNPNRTYEGNGWKGWKDFLGNA